MTRIGFAVLAFAATAAASGCSTAPGTGWSRAPDLSVYSALNQFGRIARDQTILCRGFPPASTEAKWQEDFGGREHAIGTALAARYGPGPIEAARSDDEGHAALPCRDVPDQKWRREYVRLLRLLETRLGLT